MNFSKIQIKKTISACVVGAVAFSAAAFPASAIKTIGSASIYLADETWSSQVYWGNDNGGKNNIGIASVVPAEITGDGTYTTSVEFENTMDYGFYFSLNSDIKGTGNGTFADYPDAEMTITSVKADGKEISGNASIADINDDGYMKINIFDPLTDADGNYADSLEWTSGIKSMEVTFTVTGTGVLSAELDSEEEPIESVFDDDNQNSDDGASESDSPADENITNDNVPADDTKLPADDSTEAPDTGNAPMSPMAAATALAALAMFMTRKKK